MGVKEYMPLEEIRANILYNYPYKASDIIPVKFKDTDKQRAVYRFECDDGPKCLKKVYFDEANLLFIYSVMQWFSKCGIGVPALLPTKSGGRFVRYNDSLFIVTEWIEGRKCDYDLEDDIRGAARNLGRMHRCSYDFMPIEGSLIRKDDNNWYKTYNRRLLQIIQFSNHSISTKDPMFKLFIENFDYFYERAKHAVHVLNLIDNSALMEPAEKHNTICHLDYVNKNLIFTDNGDIYVIDFDKSKVDIPIHDIGTFLKRILKRKTTSWDYNILLLTLENYEKERELSLTEFLGLFAFLEFPQKYWKISRDYFNNRKQYNKKLLLPMLKKTCLQKDDHFDFCNKFQKYIENRFNISLDERGHISSRNVPN